MATLAGWVSNLIGWFGNLVGAAYNVTRSIYNYFAALPGQIGNVVNQIAGWFQGLPGRISGALGGVTDSITAPFKAAFNAIVSFWNNTVGRISFKAPDWVPGIGGKGWSFPKFAKGVENFADGWAIVGEQGPELAFLPGGSNVYPNQKSKDMLGGGGQPITVNIFQDADTDYFFSKFGRNIELNGRGMASLPGSVGN